MKTKDEHDFIYYEYESSESAMITAVSVRALAWFEAHEEEPLNFLDLDLKDGRDYLKMIKLDNYTVQEYYNG